MFTVNVRLDGNDNLIELDVDPELVKFVGDTAIGFNQDMVTFEVTLRGDTEAEVVAFRAAREVEAEQLKAARAAKATKATKSKKAKK